MVIDVLRASSTVTTALAQGADSIRPVRTAEEARLLAQADPEAILGGERKGVKIAGFHLGNSPAEYTPEVVGGKRIIFTTTNGTQAIVRARESGLEPILIGSFLNASAVVGRLEELGPEEIYLFCSGRAGAFSLEDAAFAGFICQRLAAGAELLDSAKAALAIWESWQGKILALLTACQHGSYLSQIGLGSDLQLCAEVDKYEIVPALRGDYLVGADKSWCKVIVGGYYRIRKRYHKQ